MKVGDLVEQRYETGQYGPNAIGIVIETDWPVARGHAAVKWCDDGATGWVSIKDLETINESR
jgi:hypothetical protein